MGSAIAFLAASTSLDDIVLVNRTKSKAVGEALDITNAIPKNSSISIDATDDFSKIKNSDVIIIAASAGVYTISRTEVLPIQVKMIKEIANKIKTYNNTAKILLISNPVDVLTYVFQKETSFPKGNVIGIASSLDSSRFRFLVSKELEVNQSEITDAYVLGEHGDSMVPIFSYAKQSQISLLELLNNSQIQTITSELRDYWRTLRKYKSRSVFGIAKNTYDATKSILKNEEISIPASILLQGEYDISDVCIGVPIILKKDGAVNINEINLSQSENEELKNSANVVKNYLKSF